MPPDPPRTETFSDRAKREAERFRLATDSEYWIAFCFRAPAARDAFARATRAGERRRVPGESLPQQPAAPDTRPRALRMLMARSTRGLDTTAILTARPAASPLTAVPDTGDLESYARAELTAVLAALTAPPDPAPANVLDSPWHVTAWWPHRKAKDEWLAATGVEILGDKYIDGHQAARVLGINLGE